MILHKLLPLFALGLNLLLLGSALAPERKSARHKLFAYLASALALWNLGVLGLRWTDDPATALIWERFLHLGVIPIPVLFYHYVLVFIEVPRRRPSLVFGYLLSCFFIAVSQTSAFMPGVTETYWGFAPAAGPMYGPFIVYVQTYLVVGLVRLVRAYRALESNFRRNRTLLVIFGVGVSLLGGVIDFMRFVFGWEQLYPVGIPSNAVFALALGVAIVRYRLMDIGLLAKRLVLYDLTAIAVAPILFLGLYVVDQLAPHQLIPGDRIGTDIRSPLILLLAFTVSLPLLRKLEVGLDRLMFQRQHGVRDALVALSKEMASVLDIQRLGQTLTEGLVARIPVMHASLHLCDPATETFVPFSRMVSGALDLQPPAVSVGRELVLRLRLTPRTLVVEETAFRGVADPRMRAMVKELEAGRVALLVPLLLEGELTGVLVLGEKLSGEIFDPNEIELLEALMEEAAIALKNSGLYEDLWNQMDELKRTQQQLVQSAKLAAIGELAASIAHEINNPLMVILGNSGLLLRGMPPDSPGHGRVTKIETEANRAAKIVRNLLDFARRREPKREPLGLHDLIVRTLDLLHAKLAEARVEAETVFDPAVPPVLGDGDQLRQVLINLITNAADAMPNGGSLLVRTELRRREGEPWVAVSVTDTGIGMDTDQLARIYEPFYTTKPEGRGTGLGLSVSLGIVRNHGGTIEAESKPGKGTTMVVCLPLSSPS
jgi:signal transduction histidine kinase